MNKPFFRKLKNNIFKYFLEFFSFTEIILLLQINKRFKHQLQESKNLKYFQNVRNSLLQYSFPNLLSNNSVKIEEFLSIELRNKSINNENEWNQLLEVVFYFLSKKFMKNYTKINNVLKSEGNFDSDKVIFFNDKKDLNYIYFPKEDHFKAQFYLKKSIKACNISQISLLIENNKINKKNGKCLAKLLNRNKFEKFSINNCKITRNGILEFFSSLKEKEINLNPNSNKSNLKIFEIRFCYLKDCFLAKILSNFISKNFYGLETLDISCNYVGKDTFSVLNESSKNLRIKKLKMEKCILSEFKESSLLCKYLLENLYLTHLSLLSCDISEKAFLQLTCILNRKIMSIQSLGLSVKNYSQEVFNTFFNAIIAYKKLRTLKLTICNFSLYGLSCVSRILSDPECEIEKIELNKIDFKFSFSKDFPFFLKALVINSSLVSLSFTECYFSEEQISLIFNVMSYKKIQIFKLTNFKFSLTHDLLAKLKFIKKFTFSHNEFTYSDLKEIIISMKNKNLENIEIINLSYNPFLFPDLMVDELIFQIISNGSKLKKLYLRNNFIQNNDQEKIRCLCNFIKREIFLEF